MQIFREENSDLFVGWSIDGAWLANGQRNEQSQYHCYLIAYCKYIDNSFQFFLPTVSFFRLFV